MGAVGTLNLLVAIPASALGGFLYEIELAMPFLLGGICVVLIFFLIKEPVKREV